MGSGKPRDVASLVAPLQFAPQRGEQWHTHSGAAGGPLARTGWASCHPCGATPSSGRSPAGCSRSIKRLKECCALHCLSRRLIGWPSTVWGCGAQALKKCLRSFLRMTGSKMNHTNNLILGEKETTFDIFVDQHTSMG